MYVLVVVSGHPILEPLRGQFLAFLQSCPTSQADRVHLIVPGESTNISLGKTKNLSSHHLHALYNCDANVIPCWSLALQHSTHVVRHCSLGFDFFPFFLTFRASLRELM